MTADGLPDEKKAKALLLEAAEAKDNRACVNLGSESILC